MSLTDFLDRYLPQVEAELQEIVGPPDKLLEAYYGMMHYHLGWVDAAFREVHAKSGKRIRPLICLLCNQAAGGKPEQALPAAAAMELVHNFSLVHDDIQDGSRYRRGRQAVWDVWGAAQAINVGDGMFVLARLALHRLAAQGVPFDRQQAATLALDQACLALCEGQYFDMTFEDRLDIDLDQYLRMIGLKTATLLAASAQVGAIVAGAPPKIVDHYSAFGHQLGMAFQIQDDILGTWGDERVTGKSAATDIRDKKKTLPVVYTLNRSEEPHTAAQLIQLYSQEGRLDEGSILSTLDLLERMGARAYAEEMAAAYHRSALARLEQAGADGPAGAALRELAASLWRRQA
jgi:geranylgeranyl diphosphate synthase type I